MNNPNKPINKILEDPQARRAYFEESTKRYKNALSEQVGLMQQDAQKYGKIALAVAGGVGLTYFIFKKVFKKNKKAGKTDVETIKYAVYAKPKKESTIVTMIITSITTFLLGIAKEKIANFIEEFSNRPHEKQQHTSKTRP